MQQVYDSQRLSMPQGVELCMEIPEDSGKYVITDSVRLKQVVNNLINNAKKFTVKGNITFGYEIHDPGYTTIFVQDVYKRQNDGGAGTETDNRMFKNRMYFNVMYGEGDYMYSTAYHTAYHLSTMSKLCSVCLLYTSSTCRIACACRSFYSSVCKCR